MRSFFVLLTYISFLFAQAEISSNQITYEEQVRLFNHIELLAQKSFDTLSVRVLAVDNESGSAGFPNCEVSTNIYIAVSGFDEFPEQNLFQLSPLYSPKILKIVEEKSKPYVYLSFIEQGELQCIKIDVSLERIHLSLLTSEDFLVVKEKSVIFFHPSEEKINNLTLSSDLGFNEIISDFAYYSEKIESYLIEQNIKPIITSAKFVTLWYRNHKPKTIFHDDLKHLVGFILTNKTNEPYIFEGIFTDIGIKEEIDEYFKIDN